jgi:hypothetical protein
MRDRDFLKMFLSEGSAGIGSQVSLLALPLTAIVLLHASAFEVGTLSALGTIPYLLFGLPVGVWLERGRRRLALLYSALGRAAVLGAVPVLWAFGHLDVEVLYGVAFLVGLMTTFYDIAWQAYLPSLVGTSRLHEASARLSLCDSGSQLVGPGLAGLLIRALSAPVALAVDALGFVVAGLSMKRIRRPEPVVPVLENGPTMREQVAEGLRFVAGHHLLRWTAVYVGATNAVGAALNVVLVLFEARVLHFSAGTIGAVFLLGNVGFVLERPWCAGSPPVWGSDGRCSWAPWWAGRPRCCSRWPGRPMPSPCWWWAGSSGRWHPRSTGSTRSACAWPSPRPRSWPG